MPGNTNIFISNDQIKLYQSFAKGIITDLGRDVTLHIPGPRLRCFNCLFDPVNKKSAGIYNPQTPPTGQVNTPFTGGLCPTCKGTGQFTTETTKLVQASIRWLKSDQKRYLIQGLEAENDFRLKCDIKYTADFKAARLVVIDGTPAEVTVIMPRGLRDLINIVVFLKRSEFGPGRQTDVSKY